MDSYIEITVLPDLEADACFLMNNLCSKLHAVLGQTTDGKVGVSFPEYAVTGKNLGTKLRLHGSAALLEILMAQGWLKGLRDYCHCGVISSVPANAKQRYFARRQLKSAHNKRQRSVSKGWLTPDAALTKFSDEPQKLLKLPYLQLTSRGSKQQMRVFVEQGPIVEQPTDGCFNSYGLSRLSEKVTVPWF
ncbi:type I-F CRISPR-associated endoribonuclease Cas6/Csy4 [Bowmanella sp. Y26]|uniref:type I-F CRISPR-associated endoribonuclease Cas6/Csy4 n=1 Tax=Bowmanella yangjiangensis TaxID=2811230 RepID=UPI001BDD6CA1|nr:type I-F CRISPR-associated endoribonuclease Cas6/Csy4 [Bowmanella yangjiangensis]MBT1062645.1 type I-F CRISPR-associated endoribonuclease Cas6/Csy4 [Bowmanella yangjiangensis]